MIINNVINGNLENGARIDFQRQVVAFIGGPFGGSSTLDIFINEEASYTMNLKYYGSNRSFNIDINEIYTEEIYTTGNDLLGFINLTIKLNKGINTLKFYGEGNKYAPRLGEFSLDKVKIRPPKPEPIKLHYNVGQGKLSNFAKYDSYIQMVRYLGGYNIGSSLLEVNIDETSEYVMELEHAENKNYFRLDVNGIELGVGFHPPTKSKGIMTIILNLNKGINTLKFSGYTNQYAPFLGKFTLVKVGVLPSPDFPPTPSLFYDLTDGVLENKASLSHSRNMVTNLGGPKNGSVKIAINVLDKGEYNMRINFQNGAKNLKIDVNDINTGVTYLFPYKSYGNFTIRLNLKSGYNILKFYGEKNKFSPNLGSFTLEHLKKSTIISISPQKNYDLTKGTLLGSARINSTGNFVIGLGGKNNGAIFMDISVTKAGLYNIFLKYRKALTFLRIDINGINTDIVYRMPAQKIGVFTTVLNLLKGKNTLKFYANTTENSPSLETFSLSKIFEKQLPTIFPKDFYSVASGVLENGASLDISSNFVTNIGGPLNGTSTVTITATIEGLYDIYLSYLSKTNDRNLKIDVNGFNIGFYTPPNTASFNEKDALIYKFRVALNKGNNTIKFYGDNFTNSPMLGNFKIKYVPTLPLLPKLNMLYTTTFHHLNSLNYDDLISDLRILSWDNIPGLFEFSRSSYTFFSDSSRIEKIISALEESGKRFEINNDDGIETLVEVLKAAFYLGEKNRELSYLIEIEFLEKCLPAIKATQRNFNFKLGTETQNYTIINIGKLLGSIIIDLEILNNFIPILEDYYKNIKQYSLYYSKNQAVYTIIRGVVEALDREVYLNGDDAKNTTFYGRLDAFISIIESLTKKSVSITAEDATHMQEHFVYNLGKLAKFKINKFTIHKTLTDCAKTIYSPFSLAYFEALYFLDTEFNGKFSDGTLVNYNDKITEGKNRILPNEYYFENGKIIMKTGNLVAEEKVKNLYWAATEVRAHFFRFIGRDVTLETGHKDDILTIVIYNSPKEYTLNYRLNNLNTDNGGIYIEDEGTFYTYERKSNESIYTLEELFRHEYVHYLQGKYLVPGLWGISDFYSKRNLGITWYEEGGAEFFAGSTRVDGIKMRKNIIESISDLNKNSILSIYSIVISNYSSNNNFYNYSCVFLYYLYYNNISILRNLNSHLINNHSNEFFKYMDNLSKDYTLNSNYTQFAKDLIKNVHILTIPLVSNDYIQSHTRNSLQNIIKDIQSLINLKNIKSSIETSQFFQTCTIRGTYILNDLYDYATRWTIMDNLMNSTLKKLSEKKWSGYNTFTAYFTDYVDNSSSSIFKVIFHGIF